MSDTRIEREIASIADRAAACAFINDLPAGACVLILVRNPDAPHDGRDGCGATHESYTFRELGEMSAERSVYMALGFLFWMMGDMRENE